MQIIQYPNEHLRTSTKNIEKVTPELVETGKEMYKTMIAAKGIGLAATQVGLDISLIVLEDDGEPLIIFNPTILKRSKEQEYGTEGCLSFTGVFRLIKRPTEITAKYRDMHGKMQYQVFKGLQARAFIHEYEHLHGKLFIDLQEKETNEQKAQG